MPSETEERRPARLQHGGTHPPEHHPCPRCSSPNTKFCYYNNYNLSQPRHFCKACRRYWTRGGTLRNVPVGGGTRKNPNKRCRTTAAAAVPTSSYASSDLSSDPIPVDPVALVVPGYKTQTASLLCADVNLNETVPEAESYESFLNPNGGGVFYLGGFGSGFREMGFGVGGDYWRLNDVSGGNGSGVVAGGRPGGGGGAAAASGCNTWQMGGVEGGLADGDCFGWSDLAISTPGKNLK